MWLFLLIILFAYLAFGPVGGLVATVILILGAL